MTDLLRELGGRVASESREAYFVGGCVRDLLRGEPLKDIDLALRGDTFAIGRMLAREYRGHVFWLREEEGVVRVMLPRHEGLQIDLCPLHGTLESDLRARDLTVNAMAIAAIDGLNRDATILDPMGGKADLDGRRIRFCTPAAPEEDPLRTMRALRFRWKLEFELDEQTYSLIRQCVPLLARVSVERIRDELFQLLAIRRADEALAECFRLGVGRWLVGREYDADREERTRAPELVGWLLRLLEQLPSELRGLLETEPTPPRRRREVLLWAAALQPMAPAVDPGKAARYLALSNDERQLMVKGLEGAGRVKRLLEKWPASGKERYRHFRGAGVAAPESVLLDGAARLGWSDAHDALLGEALDRVLRPQAPLLTGSDVMRLLSLPPGPRVGVLLTGVEEARADGLISTEQEAQDWLLAQVH